jgi:hypothetical protein
MQQLRINVEQMMCRYYLQWCNRITELERFFERQKDFVEHYMPPIGPPPVLVRSSLASLI